jgi:hypothetical protein
MEGAIRDGIRHKQAELETARAAHINRFYKKHTVDKKGRHFYPSEADKRLAVQTLEKWIEDREELLVKSHAMLPIWPAPIETPITSSAMGVFSDPVVIVQTLDARHLLCRSGKETVCIAGIDTKGLVDGEQLKLTGIFAVTGARVLTSPAGYPQTVAELHGINEESLSPHLPPVPDAATSVNSP